jgi:hypothetical protein
VDQLVASVTVALVLLALVLRDVLVDHGRVVQATSLVEDDADREVAAREDELRIGPGARAEDEAAA